MIDNFWIALERDRLELTTPSDAGRQSGCCADPGQRDDADKLCSDFSRCIAKLFDDIVAFVDALDYQWREIGG